MEANNIYKDKTGNYYLLFVFSPIISVIQSFRYRKDSAYKNMLWLLIAFYGFTITFPSSETNIDGLRRAKDFEITGKRTNFTFSDFKRNLEDKDSAQ